MALVGKGVGVEVRRPKAEIRKKAEIRSPKAPPPALLQETHAWQRGERERASFRWSRRSSWIMSSDIGESFSRRPSGSHASRFGFRASAFFRTSDFGFRI